MTKSRHSAPAVAAGAPLPGAQGAAEHRRWRRLAGALNVAMARALGVGDEQEMLVAVGSALEEVGLHLLVGLRDAEGQRVTLRYNSLAPDLRAAANAILGRSLLGASIPMAALGLSAASPDRAAAQLLPTADVLRGFRPDMPRADLSRVAAAIESPWVALAPLRASGDLLGVCAVAGHLRPDDLALVQAWADAVAGLLAQYRLLAAVREQARRQAALAALTADLAAAPEPQTVLERAVDAAAELLGAYSVAIFLLRPDGRGFDVAAARGLVPVAPGTPALSLENSIAGRTVRRNAVQAVEDAAIERAAGTAFPHLTGDVPVGALLVAPIAEGATPPGGVLEVYAAEARAWPDEDRELLRALAAACAVALRAARERERARREVARSRALVELSATLYTLEDPEAVLHSLVQGACSSLEASRAVLIRLASPDGRVIVSHEYAAPGVRRATELVDPAASRLWKLMSAQRDRPRPIVVDDVESHVELAARWKTIAEEQRPRSILAAPLLEEGQLGGVVVVHQCGQRRRWEPEEVSYLQTLATQAAVALRQRRLFVTIREDARRLSALNRVAATMIGAPTFGAMCDRVLAALLEALDADAGAIHVYDEAAPAERALRMIAWQGISEQAATAWSALPLGYGVVGQAAQRRTVVFAGELAATPPEATGTLDLVRQEELEGRVCAPMLARGRLLGVLTAATRLPRTWDEADLRLLETIANQLAVALEAEDLRSAAAAAAAAREADRLKSELLSTVSHELRTPLGAIKGFASGLLTFGDRLDAAERLDSLRCIDDAADRLTELIDNLLALQRLEEGRLAVSHETVDLAELAATVVAEMDRHAPDHVIKLSRPGTALFVEGDARRLRQVLQNLIENAIKYSPDGGCVAVRLGARAGTVELRVEDQGIGIPPDQLALVFERFHRVDSSLTRRIGGTGLGLAIVKGLVAAHGGDVQAYSGGEGHGSTFVVTLPRITATDLLHGTQGAPVQDG